MKLIYIMIIALSVSSCGLLPASMRPPTTDEKALLVNYGRAITKGEMEIMVRNGMGLKDPYSAQIDCTQPSKGHGELYVGIFNDEAYGYVSVCSVNGKNSFGGYTGAQKHIFCLNSNDGHLHQILGNWKLLK
jgi:hypothetical protein